MSSILVIRVMSSIYILMTFHNFSELCQVFSSASQLQKAKLFRYAGELRNICNESLLRFGLNLRCTNPTTRPWKSPPRGNRGFYMCNVVSISAAGFSSVTH